MEKFLFQQGAMMRVRGSVLFESRGSYFEEGSMASSYQQKMDPRGVPLMARYEAGAPLLRAAKLEVVEHAVL